MKVIIKRAILVFLTCLAYGSGWCLLRRLRRKNSLQEARILRYHSVCDSRKHETNVKVSEFRKEMKFIREHCNPISLSNLVDGLMDREKMPERSVVVTFDDGYQSNFVYARPILEEFGIPATFFLLSNFVGTSKMLEHDKGDASEHNRALSWDEIRAMRSQLIDFGSHGMNHARLGIMGEHEARREFSESKLTIEKELGEPVKFFSYPFGVRGDFTCLSRKLAADSGYLSGCSAMYGSNNSETDPYELRRIGIEASETMFTFRAKLNGALDILLLKETSVGTALTKALNFILRV